MKTKKNILYRWLDHLLVVGLSVMGIMVLGNVILRYVFNSGIEYSEEVSRFIFVWITFIGAVVALKEGLHLGMDTLVQRMPPKLRKICFWLSQLLMLWCCWLLFIGSWVQTQLNLYNIAPVSELPIAILYSVGMVASALMALILLANLWRSVKGGSIPAQPQETIEELTGASK
jgi:TRAP-type C4-dicarboxylate transport system permease small subunit